MGNQARVANGATVVSTSTRNFPNRLGQGANVYLASAELAAVSALLNYQRRKNTSPMLLICWKIKMTLIVI